jgi:hypothetical protein
MNGAPSISQGLKPGLVVGCNVRAEARTYLRGKSNGKGKGEMRGSLHCAAHGEAVSSFGRDDGGSGRGCVVLRTITHLSDDETHREDGVPDSVTSPDLAVALGA